MPSPLRPRRPRRWTCSHSGAPPARTNGSPRTMLSTPRSRRALARSGARPRMTSLHRGRRRPRARSRLSSFSTSFRGQARTYETDAVARAVADRALKRGFDRDVPQLERRFFYLPFMHSEILADHERCLELARGLGDDEVTQYAELHADIIRRFGRFPHRNAMLGRVMTPDEQAFLDAGGFA